MCGLGLDLLQSSGEFLFDVCHTGVGNNIIYCNGCIRNADDLKPNLDNWCAWCRGTIDYSQESGVKVGPDKLEVVASFCYLTCFPLTEAVSWRSLHILKRPGRLSGNYY